MGSPAPIGRIPILVGGQGEQKTFQIAQYADELNTTPTPPISRKFDALQGHLNDLGRDRHDITVTSLGTLAGGKAHDAAVDKLKALINARGFDADALLADEPEVPDNCSAGSSGATRTRSSPASRSSSQWGSTAWRSTWSPTPTTSRRSHSPARRSRKLSADATPVASGRRTPTGDVTPSSGGPSD